MTYSTHNPAFGRQRGQQHAALVNDEARLANELQAEFGCGRTEALREAARLIRVHGLGVTIGPQSWVQAFTARLMREADRRVYHLDRVVQTARLIDRRERPFTQSLIDAGYCLDRITSF